MTTYYETLGVEPDASTDEIKRAWRHFTRLHHPDVAGENQAEIFIEGKLAAETLLDEDKRVEYDEKLRNPEPEVTEEPEPLDDWVSESDVEVVIEELEPEPERVQFQKPPPMVDLGTESRQSGASIAPESVRVIPGGMDLRLVVLATFVAAISVSLWSHVAFSVRLAAVAGAFLLAATVGFFELTTPRIRRGVRKRIGLTTRSALATLAVLAVAAHIAMWWRSEFSDSTIRLIVAALIAALGGWWSGVGAWFRRLDAKVLKMKALRNFQWFGADPKDVNGMYLSKALERIIEPNMRVFTLPTPAYSHAVISGGQVWLLRCIGERSGRFEAASGFVTTVDPTGRISVVAEGPFAREADKLQHELGKRAIVTRVFVSTAHNVTGDAVSVEELPAILSSATVRIDRSICVDTLLAAMPD